MTALVIVIVFASLGYTILMTYAIKNWYKYDQRRAKSKKPEEDRE